MFFRRNFFRTNINNCEFIVSGNSGKAVATEVMVGLAGTIHSGTLENAVPMWQQFLFR